MTPVGVPPKPPSGIRYLIVALLVPVSLGTATLWLRMGSQRSELLRQQAARSFDRRAEQVTLLSRLTDAEAAQRAYLLTGDRVRLHAYESARRAIRERLRVAAAAEDFPPDYSAALVRLTQGRLAEFDKAIATGGRGNAAAMPPMLAAGDAQEPMNRLRSLIEGQIASESAQAGRERASLDAHDDRLRRIEHGVVGILIGVLLAGLLFVWRMRWQRHALLLGALEAAKRHAAVIDSTIDAILIVNPAGTVERVNAAATRMLGHDATELERRDIAAIVDLTPGDDTFHARIGLVGREIRRPVLPDQIVRHRDGHAVAVDVAVGVMDVPSGVHLVVSLRDIGERKRLERMKDELVSTVSHELRTPLTSVIGSLGLLRAGASGAIPTDAARLVEIAESNGRRLMRLVNDMLDIDRMESGKLVMDNVPVDLRTVVDQARLGVEGLARGKAVVLSSRSGTEPLIVQGDPSRLEQVVTNLVSNAVRVAPTGSAVEIVLTRTDGRAIVAVDDRGAGIPADFRERIFGRFERATSDGESIGTGLGLAISREIIVRHGGAIWFEDRSGGGTRFAFSVPLAGGEDGGDGDALAVLICESDERIAADLAAAVVAEGGTSDRVRSASEGHAALSRRSYGALLISLFLPEGGGLAFARAARSGDRPHEGSIVIIAETTINDGPSALDLIDTTDIVAAPERLGPALRTACPQGEARVAVVLHLNDDPVLIEAVTAAIGPEARIVGATDIASARAILQDVSPDVAILDRRVLHDPGRDLIPFVFDADGLAVPTIIHSPQDVSSDEAAGAGAVLVKAPGAIPDLRATIRRIVRSRRTGS